MELISVFLTVVKLSVMATIIFFVAAPISFVLKRLHISKRLILILWGIVFLRMICPVSISSAISFFNIQEVKRMQIYFEDTKKEFANNKTVLNQKKDDQKTVDTQAEIIKETIAKLNKNNEKETIAEYNKNNEKETQSINRKEKLLQVLSILWLCGIFCYLLQGGISYCLFLKKISSSVIVKNPYNYFKKARKCLGDTKNIYISDQIHVPCVIGCFYPKIYIPSYIKKEEWEYIICHEQMHIKYYDPCCKLLAWLFLSIHWFNPCLHLAYKMYGNMLELACDESVILVLGEERKADYSQALFNLSVKKGFYGYPLAFSEHPTKERVRNILKFKKEITWVKIIVIIFCFLFIVIFGTNMAMEQLAENRTQKEKQEKTNSKEIANDAKQFYEQKHSFHGDTSNIETLLKEMEIYKKFGEFTMQVHTQEKPYSLELYFIEEPVNEMIFNYTMTDYANLLLALIDNVETIQWTYSKKDGLTKYIRWSVRDAETMLGKTSIKEFGESEKAIEELLNQSDYIYWKESDVAENTIRGKIIEHTENTLLITCDDKNKELVLIEKSGEFVMHFADDGIFELYRPGTFIEVTFSQPVSEFLEATFLSNEERILYENLDFRKIAADYITVLKGLEGFDS